MKLKKIFSEMGGSYIMGGNFKLRIYRIEKEWENCF